MGKEIVPLPIVWDKKEYENFQLILDNIRRTSPANAVRVKNDMNNKIKSLPNFPLKYRKDELRSKNNGSYRVFNQDNIRISYRITAKNIQIVRVRHAKQEPFNF